MKNMITVAGHVLVCDILAALEPMVDESEMAILDKALNPRLDDRLMFDDCEVHAGEAVDALDDAGQLPEPEGLDYLLDERKVIGLSEAIRCGDRKEAELLLDILFADADEFPTIREWIERGRYSRKAREAKAAERAAPKLRTAA